MVFNIAILLNVPLSSVIMVYKIQLLFKLVLSLLWSLVLLCCLTPITLNPETQKPKTINPQPC